MNKLTTAAAGLGLAAIAAVGPITSASADTIVPDLPIDQATPHQTQADQLFPLLNQPMSDANRADAFNQINVLVARGTYGGWDTPLPGDQTPTPPAPTPTAPEPAAPQAPTPQPAPPAQPPVVAFRPAPAPRPPAVPFRPAPRPVVIPFRPGPAVRPGVVAFRSGPPAPRPIVMGMTSAPQPVVGPHPPTVRTVPPAPTPAPLGKRRSSAPKATAVARPARPGRLSLVSHHPSSASTKRPPVVVARRTPATAKVVRVEAHPPRSSEVTVTVAAGEVGLLRSILMSPRDQLVYFADLHKSASAKRALDEHNIAALSNLLDQLR